MLDNTKEYSKGQVDSFVNTKTQLLVDSFSDFDNFIPQQNHFRCGISNYRPNNAPNANINYWYCIAIRFGISSLTNTCLIAIPLNANDTNKMYVKVFGSYDWEAI